MDDSTAMEAVVVMSRCEERSGMRGYLIDKIGGGKAQAFLCNKYAG